MSMTGREMLDLAAKAVERDPLGGHLSEIQINRW